MAIFLAFPVFIVAAIIQMVIMSQLVVLHGTADLLLLITIAWALQKRVTTHWHWGIIGGLIASLTSAVPIGVYFIGYLIAVGIAFYLKKQVWRLSIVAMFLTTLISTLVIHILTIIALRIFAVNIPFLDALNLITLPSLLLNLIVAIPVYALVSDLANWVYPTPLKV